MLRKEDLQEGEGCKIGPCRSIERRSQWNAASEFGRAFLEGVVELTAPIGRQAGGLADRSWESMRARHARVERRLTGLDRDDFARTSVRTRAIEAAAVVALTAVALLLRVNDLSGTPPGIHGDETEFALDALRWIGGDSIGYWTEAALGNPAGYSYWMGVIFWFGDASTVTMRLASAIPGAALVPIGYLLVRSLFPARVAMISAALTAFGFFFLVQSKIAFPSITSVLLMMVSMWLMVSAVRSGSTWLALAGGTVLGLGLYTFKLFLVYYLSLWAIAIPLVILSAGLRRRRRIVLMYLVASVVVAAPLLWFYATAGYIADNLSDQYGVTATATTIWAELPGLAAGALLLVHLPITGNTVDATPAIPVVTFFAALFFWIGLVATILLIRRPRYQLLLLGWLIGMAPILLVPGSESRRYLLGMFFVLVLVAVGLSTAWAMVARRVRKLLREIDLPAAGARWIGYGAAAAFVALFAFQNLQRYEEWAGSDALRWFFNHEYHRSILFLDSLEGNYAVRGYSARTSFNDNIRMFLLPQLDARAESTQFGGDGTIDPDLDEDTVFVLLDDYLGLVPELKRAHPNGRLVSQYSEEGNVLWTAYVVDTP